MGAAALAMTIAACGARTELRAPDGGLDEAAAFAADAPDGGVPVEPEDAGTTTPIGPCFLCRSPLVQECGYCLIQGFETTWVCPLAVAPPVGGCGGLLEDHTTSKGSHFTCWYCP